MAHTLMVAPMAVHPEDRDGDAAADQPNQGDCHRGDDGEQRADAPSPTSTPPGGLKPLHERGVIGTPPGFDLRQPALLGVAEYLDLHGRMDRRGHVVVPRAAAPLPGPP